MHGFGDYSRDQNEKTAKLIEDYLLSNWLPIFRTNGEFSIQLMKSKYKELIKEYEENKQRASNMQKQLDPDSIYSFEQDNFSDIKDIENLVAYLPADDET